MIERVYIEAGTYVYEMIDCIERDFKAVGATRARLARKAMHSKGKAAGNSLAR